MNHRAATWFRIQKRMLLFYAEQFSDPVFWFLKILVNWFIFLCTPLWIGFAYMWLAAREAWKNRSSAERKALTGRIWFWEQFDLY